MAASLSSVQDALNCIPPNLSRDDWWKVAAALKNEFGDSGFELFDQWSQGADSYKAADTATTWRSTNANGNGGSITIATLFKLAQEHGHRPHKTAATATKPRRQATTNTPASSAAQAYWDGAEDCASHPYAERKGVDTVGLKMYKGNLLIPAYNAAGKLSSLQEIDKDGGKKFLAGCRMSGCWYTIFGDDIIVVAEGWATAKSIHLATGHTGVVAFSSSGFSKVPPLLRQKYPDARIILAPDNDESQDAVKKATAAARECGCDIIVPQVDDGSDFNDLHLALGLDEVRRQFAINVEAPRLHDLVVVRASDVEPEQVTWLWPGKFPRGKLVLLGGQPSTGKSTIAFNIAAIVTTGGQWPYSLQRAAIGDVVILTAEDDLRDTVVPRLLAAGADLLRVDMIEAVGKRQQAFLLAKHLEQLDGLLRERPDVVLVIFDPLSAFLGAQDSHRESDVREILGPVAQLAAKYRVTILGIAHLNKNEQQSAMARFMGSGGIIAAARSAYLTARIDGHLMMLPVKNNLAAQDEASGLTYIIRNATLDSGIRTSAVEWTGETDLWASEALAQEAANLRAPKLLEAREWLANYLAAGPARQRDIKAAAREAGHAWATVRRAKDELDYQSHKAGPIGGWKWYTPDQWRTCQQDDAQPSAKMLTAPDNSKMLMPDEHLRQPDDQTQKPAEKAQDAQQQKYEHLREKLPVVAPLKPAPHKGFAEDAHATVEKPTDEQVKSAEKAAETSKVLNSDVLEETRFSDGWEPI